MMSSCTWIVAHDVAVDVDVPTNDVDTDDLGLPLVGGE